MACFTPLEQEESISTREKEVGSLLFSAFPAFGQFGGALFLGVAACFLTTVIVLPGILGIIERKRKGSRLNI